MSLNALFSLNFCCCVSVTVKCTNLMIFLSFFYPRYSRNIVPPLPTHLLCWLRREADRNRSLHRLKNITYLSVCMSGMSTLILMTLMHLLFMCRYKIQFGSSIQICAGLLIHRSDHHRPVNAGHMLDQFFSCVP